MDKSPVIKRSVSIGGHKTSVSMEAEFWDKLKMMARQRNESLSTVVGEIDAQREHGNLSSACRLYVLEWAINGGADG